MGGERGWGNIPVFGILFITNYLYGRWYLNLPGMDKSCLLHIRGADDKLGQFLSQDI
jgi:hypothetical protein